MHSPETRGHVFLLLKTIREHTVQEKMLQWSSLDKSLTYTSANSVLSQSIVHANDLLQWPQHSPALHTILPWCHVCPVLSSPSDRTHPDQAQRFQRGTPASNGNILYHENISQYTIICDLPQQNRF